MSEFRCTSILIVIVILFLQVFWPLKCNMPTSQLFLQLVSPRESRLGEFDHPLSFRELLK